MNCGLAFPPLTVHQTRLTAVQRGSAEHHVVAVHLPRESKAGPRSASGGTVLPGTMCTHEFVEIRTVTNPRLREWQKMEVPGPMTEPGTAFRFLSNQQPSLNLYHRSIIDCPGFDVIKLSTSC